jgi:hypothetical protein
MHVDLVQSGHYLHLIERYIILEHHTLLTFLYKHTVEKETVKEMNILVSFNSITNIPEMIRCSVEYIT